MATEIPDSDGFTERGMQKLFCVKKPKMETVPRKEGI